MVKTYTVDEIYAPELKDVGLANILIKSKAMEIYVLRNEITNLKNFLFKLQDILNTHSWNEERLKEGRILALTEIDKIIGNLK